MKYQTNAPVLRVFPPGRVSPPNADVAHSGATGRDVECVCRVTEERFAVAKRFWDIFKSTNRLQYAMELPHHVSPANRNSWNKDSILGTKGCCDMVASPFLEPWKMAKPS